MRYLNQARDLYTPASDLTATATAPVSGKTFLTITGALTDRLVQVGPAPAGTTPLGVAKYDAATGEHVGIARGHRIITVTAGDTLTAGTPVQVGDNGHAVAQTDGALVGIAVDTADTGADCFIALR
jgi:hypothetical protein